MLQERERLSHAAPPDPTWLGGNAAPHLPPTHQLPWAPPWVYLHPSHSQGGIVGGQSKQRPPPHTWQGCGWAAPSHYLFLAVM